MCGRAFDGNLRTEFASKGQGVGLWIQVTFPRKLEVAEVQLLNRKISSKFHVIHALDLESNKYFPSADELSRDISLVFDNNVQRKATMLRSTSIFTVVKIDPPIASTTLKVAVTSVYSKANNGFTEIRVYEKEGGE